MYNVHIYAAPCVYIYLHTCRILVRQIYSFNLHTNVLLSIDLIILYKRIFFIVVLQIFNRQKFKFYEYTYYVYWNKWKKWILLILFA